MRWGSLIWELGEARGWTVTRLARELGVSRCTLWRIRAGRQAPSADLMVRSAQVFLRAPFDLWWVERAPEPAPVAVPA